MTIQENYKVSDLLLEFLISHDGVAIDRNCQMYLLEKGYKGVSKIYFNLLLEYNLVDKKVSNMAVYSLTQEGRKVAKIGIEKYINSLEQEEKLKIKHLKLSVDYFKLTIIIMIISVLATIIINVISININKNNHIENPNNNNYYTKHQIDSILDNIAKSSQKTIK